MSERRDNRGRMGIDAGATLWKLARLGSPGEAPELTALPAGSLSMIRRQVAEWGPEGVYVTGGGATQIAAALDDQPVRPVQVSEFAAWARGAALLAERAGWTLPERY